MIIPASSAIRRSITACINGRRGQGKSHFALEFSPRPALVQALDPTFKFMMEKFNLDQVMLGDYARISPALMKAVSGVKNKAEMEASRQFYDQMIEEATKVWTAFSSDFYSSLDGSVRTIIWDTGSESWELVRLARHGRLQQIETTQYGALNTEFREMIRSAQDAGVNHIILQKMKEKWGETVSATGRVSRGPTGEFEPMGFGRIADEVTLEGEVYQSLCTHQHPGPCQDGNCAYKCDPPCGADGLFHLRVTKCTQNADLIYRDFPSPTFLDVALAVYPKSEPEEWI